MPNLGQTLAANIAREKQAAIDSAAAISLQRTEEARRKFQVVQTFFEKARTFFTDGILHGEPVASLYLQVGGRGFTASGVNTHMEVAGVIDGYEKTDRTKGPASMFDAKRYASLWHEFQQWALEQGLLAKWEEGWDGGGVDSWWTLRVTPNPAA